MMPWDYFEISVLFITAHHCIRNCFPRLHHATRKPKINFCAGKNIHLSESEVCFFFFLDGLKDNGNLSGHNLFEKLKVLSLPCFFFLFKFLLIKMCSTQDGICSLEFDVF